MDGAETDRAVAEGGGHAERAAEPSGFVQSLERGLEVIRSFDAETPRQTLSDVARRTGLSRAAARRFLLTLEHLGYVHADGRMFALAPKVLQLGYAYLASAPLSAIAVPHLEELSRELGESTSASVLDGDEVVYVARVPARRIMTVAVAVGTRFPAFATSMGRVLLAALDDVELERFLAETRLVPLTPLTVTDAARLREIVHGVRDSGYAVVVQELEPGLKSVAAPVRGAHDRVVAAINVSMRVGVGGDSPQDRAEIERAIPRLLDRAAAISRDLRAAGVGADARRGARVD